MERDPLDGQDPLDGLLDRIPVVGAWAVVAILALAALRWLTRRPAHH